MSCFKATLIEQGDNNFNYFIYEWYLSNIFRMVKNIEIFLYNEQQSSEFSC